MIESERLVVEMLKKQFPMLQTKGFKDALVNTFCLDLEDADDVRHYGYMVPDAYVVTQDLFIVFEIENKHPVPWDKLIDYAILWDLLDGVPYNPKFTFTLELVSHYGQRARLHMADLYVATLHPENEHNRQKVVMEVSQ